jgi:HlyD family secretion protein
MAFTLAHLGQYVFHMSRTRVTLILIILLGVGAAVWIHERSTAGPAVAFAKVKRDSLVSSLTTNARIEPSTWAEIHAERAGAVERVAVHKGQTVRKGELLVALTSQDARAEVAAAQAAGAQARAQLETVLHGGAAQAQVDVANEIARNRLELAVAQRDYEITKRLAAKQAATGQDVVDASQRVERLQAAIAGLEKKRSSLVEATDRDAAEAKVREAEAVLEQARLRLERSAIQSPMNGTVFSLPVREGAFLTAGDPVASVGSLHKLQVRIQVDEPELGRVGVGMPVTVTWDALPGRQWRGTVEKMPTEVAPLGTRQVGVALATIDNPDLKLVPGTNVNVEVTSQAVADGLTIPKEAIRTENGKTGVYVLRDSQVVWRPIELGASSITRAVVVSGLVEGDMVALRTERALRNGQAVRPEPQASRL